MSDVWFWVWLVSAAVLFVAEIFTAGFFMLPFGIGAAVSAALAYFGIGVGWQWLAFIAVSTISFVLLRQFADSVTHEPPVKTGIDRLVGRTGVVVEDLVPNAPWGRVRIDTEEWRADAPGHGLVPVGSRVVVNGIEGTHLIVRAEDESYLESEPK